MTLGYGPHIPIIQPSRATGPLALSAALSMIIDRTSSSANFALYLAATRRGTHLISRNARPLVVGWAEYRYELLLSPRGCAICSGRASTVPVPSAKKSGKII